jgi:hypothetical protein
MTKVRASSSKTAARAAGARPSDATDRPVSAGAEATLMPIPIAAARPAFLGNAALSIKIPAILAPPSKTSFGHLRRSRPSCSAGRWRAMASYAASAATNESWVAVLAPTSSRSPRVAWRLPFGECQRRPLRPRPWVCSSATIQSGAGAPEPSCRSASVLVESRLSKCWTLAAANACRGAPQKSEREATSAAALSVLGARTNRITKIAERPSVNCTDAGIGSKVAPFSSKYMILTMRR